MDLVHDVIILLLLYYKNLIVTKTIATVKSKWKLERKIERVYSANERLKIEQTNKKRNETMIVKRRK